MENRIFGSRSTYVSINRNWAVGTRVLFIKMVDSDYFFTGSGTIIDVKPLDRLDAYEKKICMDNNWYKKLEFGNITIYKPYLHISDTFLFYNSNYNSKLPLHGMTLSDSEFESIQDCISVLIML
jgi:hypothetical protein